MTHVPGGKSHVRVQDESRMHDMATWLVILNPAIIGAVVCMSRDWACGLVGISKSHACSSHAWISYPVFGSDRMHPQKAGGGSRDSSRSSSLW